MATTIPSARASLPDDVIAQVPMVRLDVVLDECRHEVIAVVVIGLPAQDELLAGPLGRGFQRFGLELHAEKLVGAALIDKNFAGLRVLARTHARFACGQ